MPSTSAASPAGTPTRRRPAGQGARVISADASSGAGPRVVHETPGRLLDVEAGRSLVPGDEVRVHGQAWAATDDRMCVTETDVRILGHLVHRTDDADAPHHASAFHARARFADVGPKALL